MKMEAANTGVLQFPAVAPSTSKRHAGGASFTFQISSNGSSAKKFINSAQKRANHNAVERARRESLNNKFQELAWAIPSLHRVRKPSKSIIVQKSLDFVQKAKSNARIYVREFDNLRSENKNLREELNALRAQVGLPPLPPKPDYTPLPPIVDIVDECCSGPGNSYSNTHDDDCSAKMELRSDDDPEMVSTDDDCEHDSPHSTEPTPPSSNNSGCYDFNMAPELTPDLNTMAHIALEPFMISSAGYSLQGEAFQPVDLDILNQPMYLHDGSNTCFLPANMDGFFTSSLATTISVPNVSSVEDASVPNGAAYMDPSLTSMPCMTLPEDFPPKSSLA
ncbi:hypothetical protein K493DRAFT_359886 [Basidiobolus meristosporus CBS 931.73]|uniref:BHLH domain-containing protein n=1 Tax=Basidiobolus meristosporus CBS 931.73 TaxID=1314790 RepID=A0A1Y1XNX9_9FUNG|nr:hypothetical protein K493DRAFT_359886 [Basidiobolus meristosporus CBS 931.73]|eukprot:ORX87432.1 hypothetical protein K493DRAFT_359886 [Basidiobolus meristosporus CBS 931.73]